MALMSYRLGHVWGDRDASRLAAEGQGRTRPSGEQGSSQPEERQNTVDSATGPTVFSRASHTGILPASRNPALATKTPPMPGLSGVSDAVGKPT
jgi:hypothetical protein